jgi:hypothetical protein
MKKNKKLYVYQMICFLGLVLTSYSASATPIQRWTEREVPSSLLSPFTSSGCFLVCLDTGHDVADRLASAENATLFGDNVIRVTLLDPQGSKMIYLFGGREKMIIALGKVYPDYAVLAYQKQVGLGAH